MEKSGYKVEVEKWSDTDEYGKARTRTLVRGDSLAEVYKELDRVVALEPTVEVRKEPEAKQPKSTPKPTSAKKGKETKEVKGKKTYPKGRCLNYDPEYKENEPEVCPDCGTKMYATPVTKKDGTKARVVKCMKCGANWWDNEYLAE
jgi:DNA-directed RNA polymerase subunit M/transcription elongation factor TFIIS